MNDMANSLNSFIPEYWARAVAKYELPDLFRPPSRPRELAPMTRWLTVADWLARGIGVLFFALYVIVVLAI
jgi:hypothetical protein